LVGLRRILQLEAMSDYESRINLTLGDGVQQWPQVPVNVGLSRFDLQGPVHDRSKRDLVENSAVNSRNGNRPSVPARHNGLPEGDWAPGFEHHGLLRAIVG